MFGGGGFEDEDFMTVDTLMAADSETEHSCTDDDGFFDGGYAPETMPSEAKLAERVPILTAQQATAAAATAAAAAAIPAAAAAIPAGGGGGGRGATIASGADVATNGAAGEKQEGQEGVAAGKGGNATTTTTGKGGKVRVGRDGMPQEKKMFMEEDPLFDR